MAQYLIYTILSLLVYTSAMAFDYAESLRVMVNKVSPYANPTESYKYNELFISFTIIIRYYDLPFCKPNNTYEDSQTLGEQLTGNRKMNSLYEIQFKGKSYIIRKKMQKYL